MVCASPRSICAPDDPAAPNARRQNCKRADAVVGLLRIKSSANSRSSALGLSSRTSSPLTMAPTGLMRSWQTREHNSAASSRASGAGAGDGVLDIECSWKSARADDGESRMLAGLIHCGCACCQHRAETFKGRTNGRLEFPGKPPKKQIQKQVMNEAGSTGAVITRDSAAALMAPLTDLVIRAGAAILAVNRLAMKIDGKLDGSPVTEADLAADLIIGKGLARLM